MGKTKYSKLSTNEEQEPLPVRESGRTVVEEVLRVASTDPPVAKAFRAPQQTVWTDAQKQFQQGPPSLHFGTEARPWFVCVTECALWLGQLARPLLWIFVMFVLSGLLLTLDCGNRDSQKWLNCRGEGFVLRFAIWGTIAVGVAAACASTWRLRSQVPPSLAASSIATGSDAYGKMRVSNNP